MRIRSTKPEFWRSERVTRVSWDARLVLKGLESYVDDNGVGRDDLALIVGDLFQRDLVREPSRTLARVSEAISDLSRAGLVWRYEAEDTELLYLSFWEQIQRVDKPQPGRFPRPDGTLNYKDSIIRESVATVRESSRALAPGTGEQGNRGTGEQGNRHAPRPSTESDGEPRDAHYENDHAPMETVSPETVLPKNLAIDTRHKSYSMDKGLDVREEFAAFKDHARANGRTAVDWSAAFSGWLRQSAKRAELANTRPGKRSTDDKVRDGMALAARLAAEEAGEEPQNVIHFPQLTDGA